jgi:hypothetical protein
LVSGVVDIRDFVKRKSKKNMYYVSGAFWRVLARSGAQLFVYY